jgi:ADYC domain
MKRMTFWLCCVGTACSPAGAQAPRSGECRTSEPSKDCVPPRGLGGHQGPYIEGLGIERLHFTLPNNAFPPMPGTTLLSAEACGAVQPKVIRVLSCRPIDEQPQAQGVVSCQVDVSHPPEAPGTPGTEGICMSELKPRHTDPDPTHHRGVTLVRGFWDARGDWHDEPNAVTLSCDALGNQSEIHQFVEADGAITKCARTWLLDPAALPDAFLACIRMARADYCGDGRTHTFSGTSVNVATPHDPPSPADCEGSTCFEASWSKNGAVCISRARWAGPGMGFTDCARAFSQTGNQWCRTDATPAVVFSRSRVNACNGTLPEPCRPEADPFCTLAGGPSSAANPLDVLPADR